MIPRGIKPNLVFFRLVSLDEACLINRVLLFDWLEKKVYTSINSMSRNLETIFLPPAPKTYNNFDKKNMESISKKKKKNDLHDKVGIIRNKLLFLWILSMCKLRRITNKLNIKLFGRYSVCE